MPGGPEVYARAKTLGVKLLKDELEGLLSDDAEVVSIVQAKVAEAELKIRELTEAEETPA
jgi:hypothetical protein